jgi:hypothetical protein
LAELELRESLVMAVEDDGKEMATKELGCAKEDFMCYSYNKTAINPLLGNGW